MLLSMNYVFCLSIAQAGAAAASEKSFHLGVVHPSGANLIGYSVERQMDDKLYWYYTIGVPSILAVGITHYSNRDGNGLTATLGGGLGYSLYASIAYQMKLGNNNFLKLGTGLALATYYPYVSSDESYDIQTIPVIACEYRI